MVELKRMDWSDFMLVCEGCNCSAVRSMSFYMGVQDYCQCSRPISLILGVVIVSTNQKNLLTFGSDPVPYMVPDHLLPTHCRMGDFSRFISISHTS